MDNCKNIKSSAFSYPSFSDDESLNAKIPHLLDWVFGNDCEKAPSLIRIKMAPTPNKPCDDLSHDNSKHLNLFAGMSLRNKTNKALKNLTIQIPEESNLRVNAFFLKEEEIPRKNHVDIEELLDTIEGTRSNMNENQNFTNVLHRRSSSEKRLNTEQLFDIKKFKHILKEIKSSTAVDLVSVLKIIQREMLELQSSTCYEVMKIPF